MEHQLLVLVFLLIIIIISATATASGTPLPCSSTPTTASCTTEIVSFSPCLPYTAIPPTNSTSSVSSACCDAFSGILASENRSCLCTLLDEPSIFGFPLNSSRIFALPSVCPLVPELKNLNLFRNFTLQSFCSAAKAPSPMLSPGQEYQNHSDCISPSPGPVAAATPAAAAPSSFHNIHSRPISARPISDAPSYPTPSPPKGFHFGTFQVSSSTRIMKPWSSPLYRIRYHFFRPVNS